ncbi:GntR family transcriptional regulator [Pacificibacter maritimus]|uniref:GntR family transcriptional regulator n=1 Tax=Pacificibacter maritimus TaxID=762213 RepID=A0A3N4UEX1_9RHOB|nr:GntR family transcriptional regulator [Pacificibacter maritimus]RPE67005.1 GntR family transcriptional regulator [Pacificibacter maritimus]
MDIRRADKIADALEDVLLSGEYQDGDRLDEVKLAEKFGVSRTPIREALQRLVNAGLAEQLPRRGVFVRQPGPVELMEMFEAMAELEAVCGRLAASRISDAALDALEDANRLCQMAVDNNDADAYYRENERFHHIIYSQAGNSFLEGEVIRLHRRLRPFRRLQLRLRGRMRQSMLEHIQVVEALRSGAAETAGTVLRAHVAIQGEKFYHLMSNLKTPAQ